jgi:hypothetical protein
MQDYESKYSGEEVDAILGDVANKVDKVEGKGLSTEDFTTALKDRLESLQNYDDTAIREAVNKLRNDFDTLVESDTSGAIDKFKEIIAFLDGIEDSESLEGIIAAIEQQIAGKQSAIGDLDSIRRGAGKGDTSVQGVVVNNKQLTPDTKGNISLPKIPAEADIANMGFTKNKGTVTGVLVNGESKSPNSNGVVDLGEIKVDEVKFANDLTGVVEATPEMFTYRPSAGDKSVRDESAVMRRIKGNTSVWGQYVRNGDFAEGTRYSTGVNTTLSNNDDGSINIVNKGSGSDGMSQQFFLPIPAKHKVLIVMDYKRSSTAVSNVVFHLTKSGSGIYDKSYINNVSSDSRRVDSAILETTNDADLILVYPFIKGVAGEYTTMYSYMAIDLTAIFGAGYEPTTYEEFHQYYPDAYYPYCAPEVRAMRATGIETVGFNQWDEQWENGTFNTETGENISNNQVRCKNLIRIFPNTYYSLSIGDKNLGIWAMFYDENLNILQPVNLNSSVSRKCLYISPSGDRNVFLTPENASWMKFYIPAEYKSATYKGDICINLSHSGVRNGEYKPYEKNTLLLPEIAKYFPKGMHGIGDVYDEINEEMAIQRCDVRAYEEGDENNAEVKTDKTTTVYQLSEPIYTPIDEPLQLDYKVDDFGTEKMLSNAPSAPFKADIVYQFNAEGRIRDNSRNIEKLEKLVKQPSDWLEDNPSSPAFIKNKPTMPTAIAPVTEVIVEYSLPSTLLPNVIHELAIGLGAFTMPPLYQGDSMTRNVYKMVFVTPQASKITFPYSVCWRDGVAPNWANSGDVVELTFTTMAEGTTILGEWKLYKL